MYLKINGMRLDRKKSDTLNTDSRQSDSLGLDEDICVGGVQHKFTDELLCHGYRSLVRDTKIREIIQKSAWKQQTGNITLNPHDG